MPHVFIFIHCIRKKRHKTKQKYGYNWPALPTKVTPLSCGTELFMIFQDMQQTYDYNEGKFYYLRFTVKSSL